MTKISYFKTVYQKEPESQLDFDDYLSAIRTGQWEDVVLDYRTGKIKKEYLPCITPSGVFNRRNTAGMESHSGYINIDIDQQDNSDKNLVEMRDEIYADPHVYAGHLSVSGASLCVYIPITASKHFEAFCAIEKHFANTFDLVVDTKAKDIPRLRFVSHDPDLYMNRKAKKWTAYIEKQKQQPKTYGDYIATETDFEYVMQQIVKGRVNITEDYHDWITCGMALASEFGENGRSYFHDLSGMSSKYDKQQTDKKYDNLVKGRRDGVTIRSFYWMAKRAGVEIKSQRTKKIEQVGKIRVKQVGTSGGAGSKVDAIMAAQKYLSEVEGIEGDDVKQVLEQVADLSNFDLNKKSDLQAQVESCIQIFNQNQIRYNVITQRLEANGRQLTDNDVNSFYLDLLEVDKDITRTLFDTVIFSNRVKQFDPFLDFIRRNKHRKPTGNVKELLATIDDQMIYNGMRANDYKDIYVKKWLLSLMASVHGTYSLMILVLTGPQMTNKTNWFRWLLPDELRQYYAESKLDAGKDDEILMTQKLIIVDDEFGGKSKQEAKKLKDLSSKQYFTLRRPYGRMTEDIRRIAVLAGTSNDDEILNDPTGNRRIIPLKVNGIDIEKYNAIDKTDLFIELYHEWEQDKDGWMLTPTEVKWLNTLTNQHEQSVLEEDLIKKYYEHDSWRGSKLTSTDIKVRLEELTRQNLSLYKIGQSLKKLGFSQEMHKENNKTNRIWDVKEVML